MVATIVSALRRTATWQAAAVLLVVVLVRLLHFQLFERLELMTFDMRAREALRFPSAVATNLGFVFINDQSVARVRDGSLGYRFGLLWPRQVYGRLVHELADEGARAVALDVLFDELRPDQPSVRMADETWMESDDYFAPQMRRAGNVVLATTPELSPTALFLTNAAAVGDIATDPDFDGVLRRAKAFRVYRRWHEAFRQLEADPEYGVDLRRARIESGRIVIPTTRGEAIKVPLDAEGRFDLADFWGKTGWARKAKPFTQERIWQMGIVLAALELGLDLDKAEVNLPKGYIRLSGAGGRRVTIPVDSEGCFYVDWSLPLNDPRLAKKAIEDLLAQQKARLEGRTNGIDNFLRDKLVVVGTSAAIGSNPMDRGPTPLGGNELLVSKHWNVANSILTGSFVQPPSLALELVLIGLLGLASAALVLNLPTGGGIPCVLLLGGLYLGAAIGLFVQARLWLPLVFPLATVGVMAQVGLLTKRADPRRVAKLFFSHAGFRAVHSLPDDVLLLEPKEGQMAGLVAPWTGTTDHIPESVVKAVSLQGKKTPGNLKLYLIYHNCSLPREIVQNWRRQLGCEIIPVWVPMLERALATRNYDRQLREFEEPYLVRMDPYAEFKPVSDPIWFYGRGDLVEGLPAVLAQGQHTGIFGLRKVGKTSVANQLRQRFVTTPSVLLDCQALSAKAESYFDAIYRDLHAEVRAQGIRRLPKLHRITHAYDFSRGVIALFDRWKQMGRHEPFLLMIDEIDRFFPGPEVSGREHILAEYVRVFRVLRGLAQTRGCLVLLVIAYRPQVNRQNLLGPGIGENPMFNSFQECYLGFLAPVESEALVREIGLWKGIAWEPAAAHSVFRYCGGHPLVTRYFASHACQKGTLKTITEARVAETAFELQRTFRKNEIGNYYREGIWDLLEEKERRVLVRTVQGQGCSAESIPRDMETALANLEGFGLVGNREGRLHLTAELFQVWLQREASA